jgi:hypothetical protein
VPQPVKYSTSSVPNAIKKGNMAIGVNQVEYSPTSTTGWYAGISPPVSGYTVYVNKATQGPSILVASNDTDLVSVARSQGASASVTTAAGALNYFASQSDMMVVNKNYNNIVTSGLVLNVDASFVASYPVSGTSWYDISGSGFTGTLTNGPTFDSGGWIVFDGVNDWSNFGNNLSTLTKLSLECYVNLKQQSSNYNGLISKTLDNSDGWEIRTTTSTSATTIVQFRFKGDNAVVSAGNLTNNRWYHLLATGESGSQSMYVNGILIASNTVVTTPTSNTNNLSIGKLAYANLFLNGLFSIGRIYNRALSATEISQNYYGAPIVTSGLTFAVDAGNLVSFQNGSGSTFSLVGSYTGTLQNGVSYTTGGGGSWDFDGSDDWISIPTYTFGNGGWTCNIWTQGDSITYSTTGNLISNSSGGPVTNAMGFLSSKIHYRNYDGAWKSNSGNTTLTAGQWYMLTWVNYSGATAQQGTMKMFVNGNVDSGVFNSYTTNGGPCDAIGRNWFDYFNGRIGLVQFYNKSLTDVEVLQNFNAQKRRFGF